MKVFKINLSKDLSLPLLMDCYMRLDFVMYVLNTFRFEVCVTDVKMEKLLTYDPFKSISKRSRSSNKN